VSAWPTPDGGESQDPEPDRDLERLVRERQALRTMKSRLRWGTWLTVAATVGLALGTSLSLFHVLAMPLFFVLLPAAAVAQLPLLDMERIQRIPVYLGSIVTLLVLGGVSAFLSGRVDGVAPAGMTALPTGELLAWTGGLTLAGLVIIFTSLPLERRLGGGRPELMRDLLPRTRQERGLFAGLSFSAGVGEELAYRAYAFKAIQLLGPGPWAAAAIASVPFGLLHAYQGPVGILRTGLMGFVLAVPVVLTGSLLPSMAAHTLIDLLVGIVLGPRLVGDDTEPADLVHPGPGE
jgi:membrane protease YdiL (CAAX protease family)